MRYAQFMAPKPCAGSKALRNLCAAGVLLLAGLTATWAQPLPAIRNKIAAGDFYSAESLLQQHRIAQGEDGAYLQGLGWLARGAFLTGLPSEAARYAAEARDAALAVIRQHGFQDANDAVGALGAALEVEAQLLAGEGKSQEAVAQLQQHLLTYDKAPLAFRSRLYKRINQLSMEGTLAPEIQPEQSVGPAFPALAALRGKAVVLFFWAEWCGDCRAQAESVRAAFEAYQPMGVAFLAVTRLYKEGGEAEIARVSKQWAEHYTGLNAVPIAIATGAMERYGASSTPTFVFIDKGGKVSRYLPSRLTRERLQAEIEHALAGEP
ncbi:MAG: TlpA family protein disulfide reductase [Bryobacterales bacterium]|nr:TlpA family protein disulfide reductase [Bryobacterales bacterium]